MPFFAYADCVQAPSGLVSWWPGEGNANDIQSSNNGTLKNGATFSAGYVSQAFSLDGTNDFVEVPNNPNLDVTSVTIDAWVKPNRVDTFNRVLAKDAVYDLYIFSGSLICIVSPSSHGYGVGFGTGFEIQPNVWSHVACTYDEGSGKIRMFINGVENSFAINLADNNPLIKQNLPVLIGQRVYTPSYFNGLIDEVELFNNN